MKRITEKELQSIVDRLNEMTGSPMEQYTNGKSNAGCHYLSGAYGGWKLERMVEGGGCVDVLNTGYVSKRELAQAMWHYIAGLTEGMRGVK